MQTKSKKPQANKNNPASSALGDWFFMSSEQITINDLKNILQENTTYSIEVWEDAGVLEIELSEKESIDFEQMKPAFKDEAGNAFLAEHQIKTVYACSFSPACYPLASELMQRILNHCNGFFCADSDDFQPIIHKK